MTKNEETLKAIEQIGKHVLNVEQAVSEIAEKFFGMENRISNVETKAEKILESTNNNGNRITQLERRQIADDTRIDIYRKWFKVFLGIISSVVGTVLAASVLLWLRLS